MTGKARPPRPKIPWAPLLVVLAAGAVAASSRRKQGETGRGSVLERVGLWRRPAESILEALLGDWRTHVGEGEPVDDTSIVVVRRTIWS